MSRTLLTRLAAITMAAVMSALMLFGMSGTASASATGCTVWGAKTVAGHSLPTGQYCFTVDGSGTWVNWTSGSFNTGWIGYPTEIVRFYDTVGRNYASYTTFQGSGTLYGFHYWKTGIRGSARTGSVCGTLLSYGLEVARVCKSIHP